MTKNFPASVFAYIFFIFKMIFKKQILRNTGMISTFKVSTETSAKGN